MGRSSEADYPRPLELLELKKTIALHWDNPLSDESLESGEGYVYFRLDDEGYLWGNFDRGRLWMQDIDNETAQRKRYPKELKTLLQEDGEGGLEISYLPGPPWGAGGPSILAGGGVRAAPGEAALEPAQGKEIRSLRCFPGLKVS